MTWVISFWEIFKNYAKSSMVVDIVSTMPCLFTSEDDSLYYLKIFRMYHARGAYQALSDMIKVILSKMGASKGSVEKMSYIINLLIYLFSAIHILCCIWIYVGKTTECSWLNYCPDSG